MAIGSIHLLVTPAGRVYRGVGIENIGLSGLFLVAGCCLLVAGIRCLSGKWKGAIISILVAAAMIIFSVPLSWILGSLLVYLWRALGFR